jgi:hypothetical protein
MMSEPPVTGPSPLGNAGPCPDRQEVAAVLRSAGAALSVKRAAEPGYFLSVGTVTA